MRLIYIELCWNSEYSRYPRLVSILGSVYELNCWHMFRIFYSFVKLATKTRIW